MAVSPGGGTAGTAPSVVWFVLLAVALLGGAAGVVAGVRSGGLWLDESLSVTIARQPILDGSLHEALRQDGAPPLYYLLLRAWTEAFGTGTVAVRLLSALCLAVALALLWVLAHRVAGVRAAHASVAVLAALPWSMRFGSEARMYALVLVLVLSLALTLQDLRASVSRWPVLRLGLVVAALLLTHYWALFLLATLGLMLLPGLVRTEATAWRVAVGLALGGILFLPWAPTLLFQAAHTGAPWADPTTARDLVLTPRFWGGGSDLSRLLLALLLLPLVVAGARRLPRVGLLLVATLGLAWLSVATGGGAYTGRYTAVVVPLLVLLAGLGAVRLGAGRRAPWAGPVALTLLVAVGLSSGIPAAGKARTTAPGVVAAYRAAAGPGELLAYCPDQLGPPVSRLLGPGVPQLVYPTLAGPDLVDWVDYAARQRAANPAAIAREVSRRAGDRPLQVLAAIRYRTFEGSCQALLTTLTDLRGTPTLAFGRDDRGQQLFRFGPPTI